VRAQQYNRQGREVSQQCIDGWFVYLLTYHPVFVRKPLPRDLRGFLPLPATPLVADNIECAKVHGHTGFQDIDPQLSDGPYD